MKLSVADTAPKSIKHIQFGVLGPQEIVALGEFESIQPELYTSAEDRTPTLGGVLDRRLGTSEKQERCETCGERAVDCVGHSSYIKLNLPVFHAGYFKQILKILQNVCKTCAKILLVEVDRRKYLLKFRRPHLENQQRIKIAKEVNTICRKVIFCPHCKAINGIVRKVGALRIQYEKFRPKKNSEEKRAYLDTFKHALHENRELSGYLNKGVEDVNALRAITLFRRISPDDCELLGLDPQVCRPEEFIWQYVPVPPVCIRPTIPQEAATNEDDLTVRLTEIIAMNTVIKASLMNGEPTSKLVEQWDFLQCITAIYIDSELQLPGFANPGRPSRSLYQRLKGKQGRFRGNLSGKRVDFSGRTVISPDPNLRIDEVAVPKRVARLLTYPERVTRHNVERLAKAVITGQDRHPGATYVLQAHMAGAEPKKKALKVLPEYTRRKIAASLEEGDVVERHLIDGDIVLFNRQPSLHKLSIMSHRVKVRDWRTFRLNECVCTPYNADFDGDEMNIHVPQTEEARAEALELMSVKENIVTPRNGEPVIAATQDFITGSYLLSRKDSFFDRAQFVQILSYMDDAKTHFDLPKPAILKPQQLWTGKQIFNLLMRPNSQSKVLVNLEAKCRTFDASAVAQQYPNYSLEMADGDDYLIIRNSEIICGVMDKSTVGAGKKDSVFGVLLRDFGAEEASTAMNRLAKLCARYFSNRGFSIGISDVTPGEKLKLKRLMNIGSAYNGATDLIQKFNTGKLDTDPGCNQVQTLEARMLKALNGVRGTLGDICVEELGAHNAAVIMENCGSKGSKINVSQMVTCVGQQAIGGQRVPDGFVDRSLPHFRMQAKEPDAKGFVASSFYTGLTPTEFLCHAISGREGLVDTAVKTADTGYMQRRLIKALEDLSTRYDDSVRNSVGGVVQFTYGDDGLDPAKLEAPVHPVNFKRTWLHSKAIAASHDSPYLTPAAIVRHTANRLLGDEFESNCIPEFCAAIVAFISSEAKMLLRSEEKYRTNSNSLRDRTASAAAIRNLRGITEAQLNTFLDLCIRKYRKAKIEPGTAVGAVGAQSIGEPGTQMTLKTFHFAGVASMSVTLGVPRIREIINASKNISTPIVTADLVNPESEISARVVKGRIEKTYLRDIASFIAPNYHSDYIYISVHLEMDLIEKLHLQINAASVREAILAHSPKLKINEITVAADGNRLRIYPEDISEKTTTRRLNKPHDKYTQLMHLHRALPNVSIKGIKECSRAIIKVKDSKGGKNRNQLLIEGNGLRQVMVTDGVVGTQTTSNHIIEVEKVLGIEAARSTIIQQIAYTMQQHGLNVDPRHTQLLGDLMTFKGEVLGITRFGVAKLKDSVLALASFEKTMDHLFEGAFYSKKDAIHGVSERIIMGQTASHLGSSTASLVVPKPKLPHRRISWVI